MRTRIGLVALTAIALISCSDKSAQRPERTCEVRGEVIRLDAQVRTASIKHQQICDWMEAMTMEFPVRAPKDFEVLKPGLEITATVHIGDPEYWLSDVHVVK
jgi:Cu/Ag efflux protein CusF